MEEEPEVEEETESDDDEDEDEDSSSDGESKKRVKGFSLAIYTRYAKVAARGADQRIKENSKLSRRKEVIERKLAAFSIPKRATEETIARLESEKAAMIAEAETIEAKLALNTAIAESLERAADEYAYIRRYVDGTKIENLRKTPRLHDECITVKQEFLDTLLEKYNAAKSARQSN